MRPRTRTAPRAAGSGLQPAKAAQPTATPPRPQLGARRRTPGGQGVQFPIPNSNSLGCSLGPFPFASAIKCHQKSTCNSAGSSVGFLSHKPPAPPAPTAGRCGRVVPVYFPCSFVLAPRAPALRLGVKSPLHRSALAPVGSSPELVLSPVTALHFSPVCS
jgi:hypothetical protein